MFLDNDTPTPAASDAEGTEETSAPAADNASSDDNSSGDAATEPEVVA